MTSNLKTAIFWVVLICVAVLLWTVVRAGKTRPEQQLTFSHFLSQVESGRVKAVSITGNEVHGSFNDDAAFRTTIPLNYPDLYRMLTEKRVNMDIM